MKHRHRGIIARVMAFLLLGAIVNVAVAWVIIAMNRSELSMKVAMFDSFYRAGFVGVNGTSGVPEADEWNQWHFTTFSHRRIQYIQRIERSRYEMTRSIDAACSCEMMSGWPTCSLTTGRTPIGTIARNLNESIVKSLPLRPLWPGFTINTIIFAAILWLVFAVPGLRRRSQRIRRGLCPACAYPVGASDVCTECGTPVKPGVGGAPASP